MLRPQLVVALNIANTIQLDGFGFYVVGIFSGSWIASMLWYKGRGYERLA
jgi:high-affinity nickel permease